MTLDDLHRVIHDRKQNPSPESYVSSLMSKGKDGILRKIGEESAEVIIASKSGEKSQIIHEVADLWFHCMVLLAEEGLSYADVIAELEIRFNKKRR